MALCGACDARQRGWAGQPEQGVLLYPPATSGRGWSSRRVLRCLLERAKGASVLECYLLGYSWPTPPRTQTHCTLMPPCPRAAWGWVGGGGGEPGKAEACEAGDRSSGALSLLLPDVFLSSLLPPPPFILLIFISTKRFATDGKSPFNPLQEADRLAARSLQSSNMFKRCSQV